MSPCSDIILDPCRRGGDVVVRHNHLCDICQFLSLCPSISES